MVHEVASTNILTTKSAVSTADFDCSSAKWAYMMAHGRVIFGLDLTLTTLMHSLTTSYVASQQVDWPSCNHTGLLRFTLLKHSGTYQGVLFGFRMGLLRKSNFVIGHPVELTARPMIWVARSLFDCTALSTGILKSKWP